MKPKSKVKIQFVVDAKLIAADQSELLKRVLEEDKIKFFYTLAATFDIIFSSSLWFSK